MNYKNFTNCFCQYTNFVQQNIQKHRACFQSPVAAAQPVVIPLDDGLHQLLALAEVRDIVAPHLVRTPLQIPNMGDLFPVEFKKEMAGVEVVIP